MNQEERGKKMSQLIAKCWVDEGFKKKLLADPAATLKAQGVELPAGLSVKALENTAQVFHLVIPAKPTDLSDEDLDKVAAGLARKVEVQLAYAIGVAEPVSVMAETFGTGLLPDEQLTEMIRRQFSLTPRGIMEMLDLRRPIFRQTATYGHFGRTGPGFTWERTDKAATLRKEAGINAATEVAARR